ncbi:uncharacterized protein [Eurosta solidaginis]|uniref:uncharacterized protein n=1 Tax=Eurosta solidaginis TaxID=178769 RepID=UPI003530DB1C
MTRTSHTKNRPFDFKLISLVEPHPVLYQRNWGGLSTFECMKEKNRIWTQIATTMGTSPDFCLSRWNNLRNHFHREIRHCTELCPKQGIIKGSTWPYLERLRFLENSIRTAKPERSPLISENEPRGFQLNADNETTLDSSSNDSSQISKYFEDYEYVKDDKLDDKLTSDQLIQERASNMRQMAALLNNIPSEHKSQVERRILAYLCKCQLRAIANEDIDDLKI